MIAELFGKYEVTNEVDPSQRSVAIELSYEGEHLARVRLEQDPENPFLTATYHKSQENSIDDFKQLYQDVMTTFAGMGINLEQEISIHEDERVAKQSAASYTIGAQLAGILFGDNITDTITLTKARLDLYDQISKRYPNAKKDETPFGFLGEVTQGSFLLEVEEDVYIAMDNPESVTVSTPFVIQINSTGSNKEDKVNQYRKEIVEFLEQEYGDERFYFCNDEEAPLDHKFRINLSQLVGRKKLGREANIVGLLE